VLAATVRNPRRRDSIDGDETELMFRIAAAGSRLSRAVAIGDLAGGQKGLSAVRAVVSEIRRGKPVVPAHRSGSVRRNGRIRFVVDSLFLAGVNRFLVGNHPDQMAGVRERFHYCSGVRLDAQTYALTHIVPVDFAEQSAVYLRVGDSSNIAALASLDRWGMPLVAHCHSHPGRGAGATIPSGTDRRFQERLERGSHVAIGIIFSQDRYLRFFAGDESRFEVSVFGKQIKEIEKNVYKIELGDGNLPVAKLGGGIA
jgi:proteasome lid subunit RPN8/RPN11